MSDDSLIKLSKKQTDPGSASAADFKVAVPKAGEAGGEDQLVKMASNQESPRSAEDGHSGKSYGSPVPEDRGAIVARNFPSKVNQGESSDKPGTAANVYSVDFKTGQLVPNVKPTKK